MNVRKSSLKQFLGEMPFAAELYWQLRQPGRPITAKIALDRLQLLLPEWRSAADAARKYAHTGQRVLLFGTLRYWIEHAALLSVTLAGLGHDVTLAYLPYATWQMPVDRFDLRRDNTYVLRVLKRLEPLVKVVPLLNVKKTPIPVPSLLDDAVRLTALRDTQYTLQVEDVSVESDLYRLRLERDAEAAQGALTLLESPRPDVVIIPNGTILEFGAVYQTSRYLGLPVVTYEFGEQRQRLWLAQDAEVMRQNTDDLWEERGCRPLNDEQLEQTRTLFASRQRASLWESGDKKHRFARRWQGVPSEGGEKVRATLGLDSRPVVLLATNVIGDSLTLGRQVFSDSMTEWLERTAQFFARRPDVQFVARIHPGELITKGPSVAGVVHQVLGEKLPEHIHLIPADAKINTYDIVEIADLGLVYTTTVGMEMAMSGAPVVVVGNTHYRGKGFTLDPDSWESYFDTLENVLRSSKDYQLSEEQVACAWNYAYRFFFEYPHPFPWHLLHLWDDLAEWPVGRVLGDEGKECFGRTFQYLAGEPVDWSTHF